MILGDLWNKLPPVWAALLRSVMIAVIGGIITGLAGFLDVYETPEGAGATFAAFVLLARFAVEGAYDWWRLNSGRAPPAGEGVEYPIIRGRG